METKIEIISLYNKSNNDLNCIFDEYADTFFYMDDLQIKLHPYQYHNSIILNNIDIQTELNNIDKNIERINNTIKLANFTDFEKITLQSILIEEDLKYKKLINSLENNLIFRKHILKKINQITF